MIKGSLFSVYFAIEVTLAFRWFWHNICLRNLQITNICFIEVWEMMLLLIFLNHGQASGLPPLMAWTTIVVVAGSCKNSSPPSNLTDRQHLGPSVWLWDVSYAKSSYFSPMYLAKLEENTLAEATASTTHNHRSL